MRRSRDIWDIINGGSHDQNAKMVVLDPELKNKIVDISGARYLRHPACCDEYHKSNHLQYNADIAEWKENRSHACKEHNWQAYLDCYEKLFWPDALLEIREKVPSATWAQLARNAWVWSDTLWEVWPKWREVFANRADLPGFMTTDEEKHLDGLEDSIPVYRGCHRVAVDGLSWTTDWDAAVYFEYKVKPRNAALIIEGIVSRAAVIAFVDKDEEFEIIAFPEHVVERKVLEDGGKWSES